MKDQNSLKDLMAVVNSADIGLVIFDKHYTIRVWNLFMVNHSGKSAEEMIGKNIFQSSDPFPKEWFVDKVEQVAKLKQKLLTTWEERPYLFKFKNTRPNTAAAALMFQNITFIPLLSAAADINNFAIIINDLTDIAITKQQLDNLVSEYPPGFQK